jgi:hypothetical protein
MSVPITQRLLATPAFTSSMVLGKVMGDVDPLWSLQSKIDGIALIKSDVELRLAKYMTRVEMDAASASKAMREMASWSNDFGQQVSALPLNSEMPEEMRPKLPTDQARNWVAAVFFDGVYGFQFYQSGAVRRKINEGSMTVEQAESDLEARRKSFQIITAMDEAGDLARIFASKAVGDGGISIGAAIIVVAVIAVIGVLIYQHKENAANRSEVLARFDKMCEEANKNKDTSKAAAKEHEKCIDEVKPPKPAKDPIELALYMLGGVLGVYVIGYYVVPRLIAHRGVRLQVADLLSTLTPDTREKVEQLLAEAQAQYGYNLKVVSARRGCAEQAKLYAQGRTAPGKVVTNAQGCKSWHVLGRAVDIAFVSPNPSPQDWDNLGAIGEALGFKWGKRFSGTLNDLPHFEYHPGMKIEDVCPDPSDCDGGVASSMGQGGAAGEPAWPYLVVSVAAAALTWALLS